MYIIYLYMYICTYNDALLKVRRDPYHTFWRPITVSKRPSGAIPSHRFPEFLGKIPTGSLDHWDTRRGI